MSKDEKPQVDKKMFIHIAIGIILMFAGWVVPPFATVTELGMKILFIFIGVIYLWSTVESTWSSLLALIAIGISGYSSGIAATLASGFGNSTVLLVLFSMILFGGVQESGVAKYIARFFLTRKISNGRPYVFCFIFTFGIFVVSALTNTFTALMLSWPIAYSILGELGYTNKDSFSKFFVFCAFVGSILGQITIPFRGSKLGLIKGFEAAFGGSLDYLMFILLDVIMAVVLIIGLCFLCKFVYRCDVSKMKSFTVDYFTNNPLPAMTKTQKFYLATCFLYILAILIPTMFDPTNFLIKALATLGTYGITIVWVIFCCILHLDGAPVLDFKEVASKHINWGVLLLVVIAIMMSSALTAESTGIRPLIMAVLTPILGGHGIWGTAAILTVFAFLVTNFANNFVVASVMMPLWGTYAAGAGISTSAAPAIATVCILCAYLAFLTPAASPYAGMLFGNRDWFTPGEIIKMAIPFAIWIVVSYLTIGYVVAMFLFGLVA